MIDHVGLGGWWSEYADLEGGVGGWSGLTMPVFFILLPFLVVVTHLTRYYLIVLAAGYLAPFPFVNLVGQGRVYLFTLPTHTVLPPGTCATCLDFCLLFPIWTFPLLPGLLQ